MSHKGESSFLPSEEATHAESEEEHDAEQTMSQQVEEEEQGEETGQDTQGQVGADDSQQPPEIRKSGRTRKLTEKGMALLHDKLYDLNTSFVKLYTRWKYHMNGLKRSIKDNDAGDLIDEIINSINSIQVDIDHTYLEIRANSSPEPYIRKMNDTCQAFTKIANLKAQHFINGVDSQDIAWPDSKSVFDSTVSSISSLKTTKSKASSKASTHSSVLSLNAKQAEAEVMATQEVLKIMNAQHQQREEIERLEAENAKKRAHFIAESADRKMNLEKKRREIERLEELKGHVAAQARLKVYSEALQQPCALNPLSEPFIPAHQAPVSQASMKQAKPSQVPHLNKVKTETTLQYPATHTTIPEPTNPIPATQVATSQESSCDLVRILAEAITANRVPIPEPEVFTGDPLKYNDWKLSFSTLIDRKNLPAQEKLFFLRKYVGGTAKKAIEGHFLVATETAYRAAWDILEDRFGNPFIVAKSYREKIYTWQKIGHKDYENLREFVDFLSSVESAMPYIHGLQALNDCVENQRIIVKLPEWLSSRWNREVTIYQDQYNMFPDFQFFVKFLNTETRIACNPITSLYAIKTTEQESSKPLQREQSKSQRSEKVSVKTFTTNASEEKTSLICLFCKKKGHTLHKCRKIMEKAVEERIKFVQLERLCFGCLNSGHISKACTSRSVCDLCGKHHPTCLHQDREKKDQEREESIKQEELNENKGDNHQQSEPTETQQATSNRVIQEKGSIRTSAIVPVYVSSTNEPDKEVLLYALLDNQSDTTFILEDAAETLCAKKMPVKLEVSTMTSKTKLVKSQKVLGLQVRGINSDTKIKLPKTYTRDYIPANRFHIPTSTTAKSWPHLKHLAEEMSPELDCEVGLLIGYNCTQALLPRDVVMGNENQPYALRSVLGWSIIGNSSTDIDYDQEDEIGVSHRIIVKKVVPDTKSSSEIKSEVQFVVRTQVKKAQVHTPKTKEKKSLSNRLQRFSDWKRVGRAIARLKRLAKEVKGLKTRSNEVTTLEEIKNAEQFIIRVVQREAFCDEIKSLAQGKDIQRNKSTELYKLNPFMDSQGILRVGGQLTQATLHPNVKHPAILPKGHHVSRLLIKHCHEKVKHQGRGMTINELHSNGIWILGFPHEVSSFIFKCIKCRKFQKEFMKGKKQEHVKKSGCDFVMNPPASSHMGGICERQMRTLKSVLASLSTSLPQDWTALH
ncbi:uncharacterized protein LOC144006149 [Festucalex cinctus]